MRLAVPDTLKVLLVDDWEAVTKNNQVASPTRIAHFCSSKQPPPSFATLSVTSWSPYLEVPLLWKYWKNSSNIFSIRPHQSTVSPISPYTWSIHLNAFSFTPASVTPKWYFQRLYQVCKCILIRLWDPTSFTASSGRSTRKCASDM